MESSLNRWGKQLILGEEKQSNNNKSSSSSSSSSPSDDEDDCVILDGDPDKPVRVAVENNNGSQEYGSSDELLIVAEKGQIACRDYPHPRHLCARFPFNTNPHEKHCDMCHCYVCDTRAPCAYWGTGKSSGDHCHSTDREVEWRVLRQSSKQCKTTQLPTSIHSAIPLSNVPPQHPTLSRSETLNSDEEREVLSRLRLALNRLSLQSDRLTGTVKWFNSQKGYGFICSDGGGEDLFVHQSSIKSEGYQSLSEGELVEFQIEIGDDRRKQAIDVRVPGGSSVPVTTRRETYSSDTSKSYNCGETGHLARNCSNTGSDDGETVLLAGLRLLALEALDRLTVEADRLTGTVKWFNSHKGYGFITPGDGGEDLFVHQSSIKSKGYRSLAEGEVVEFRIESGDDGKKKAIDVSGPGGSFVRGTARRENYCSDIDGCYICGERGHLARNCSHTGSGGGKDYDGSYTSQCYNCGEMGHLTRDCYHKGSDGGGGRSTYNGSDISECSNYGDLRWRDGHGRGSKNSGGRPGAARNSPSKDYGWNKGFGVSSGGSFSQGTTSRDIYGRGNSNNGSDTLKCYNCGEMGHLVRHCNGGSRGVNVSHTSESYASSNFRGGGRGGGTKDCGGDSECHPCRDSGSQKAVNVRSPGGYFVREHTRKDYYCSRVGRKGDHAGGGNFYSGGDSCAERGHSLSYCHDKGTGGLAGSSSRCYTCGETGHRARDCFKGNGGEGGGSGGACYNCGEHGHLARDCGDLNWGNSGGNGRLACYYCGEFGHTRKHCPYF